MTATSTAAPAEPTPSTGRGRGPILAAIDDSTLAVPVARRAAQMTREHGRPLLLLTAVPVDIPPGTPTRSCPRRSGSRWRRRNVPPPVLGRRVGDLVDIPAQHGEPSGGYRLRILGCRRVRTNT
ncbi:MAG TPA: hypothetical protein VFJ19_12180 [Nocardioidaceae bacterium]|nr:hypothetical protein [Nocardioidaceae bacterium]